MSTQQEKIIKPKPGLLELAKTLGNLSQACQIMGNSRGTSYRYKELYESALNSEDASPSVAFQSGPLEIPLHQDHPASASGSELCSSKHQRFDTLIDDVSSKYVYPCQALVRENHRTQFFTGILQPSKSREQQSCR